VSVPGTLVKVIFETNAVKQAELED
jgi:hypothetical protein